MKNLSDNIIEINSRKTIKIKEYMLNKTTDKTLIPVINSIKNMKTSIVNTISRLIIAFDQIQIRIVPIGERFLYVIYENAIAQYESFPISTWHHNQEKYEKYKNLIDVFIPNLEKIYRYLSYIVIPKDFSTHLT